MVSLTLLSLILGASALLGRGGRFLQRRKFGYRQTLHNFENVQYFADFEIGGQKIAGIFDTGSFELLVRSTRCEHCVHPTPAYDHNMSDSYHANGTITKHVFGSGPCVSMMGYEKVTVGDLHSDHQAFWEIMEHRITVLDTAKFAAIVGIGPNFAYDSKEETLLMAYGITEFSVCLQKPAGSDGFLTWGKTNTSLQKKDYATADVIGKHHWVTTMENVTFIQDGSAVEMPCSQKGACAAIVDSGTSLIAAPGIALEQLSKMLPPIQEDCSNLHELPTLSFVVGGNVLELPPQAYVMKVEGATLEANDIWDILFFKPKVRKLNMCMPAFMQFDMEGDHGAVWILGMPFFRYYHTTFDRTEKQMHFSKAGPNCEPRSIHSKNTEEFLAIDSSLDQTALEVGIDSLVPPTLSGQMDFPYNNNGVLEL